MPSGRLNVHEPQSNVCNIGPAENVSPGLMIGPDVVANNEKDEPTGPITEPLPFKVVSIMITGPDLVSTGAQLAVKICTCA